MDQRCATINLKKKKTSVQNILETDGNIILFAELMFQSDTYQRWDVTR